jgi:hypothetical protein
MNIEQIAQAVLEKWGYLAWSFEAPAPIGYTFEAELEAGHPVKLTVVGICSRQDYLDQAAFAHRDYLPHERDPFYYRVIAE